MNNSIVDAIEGGNKWAREHYTIKRLLNKLYECVNSEYTQKVEEWKGWWCLTSM